jgi:hypothetical protein
MFGKKVPAYWLAAAGKFMPILLLLAGALIIPTVIYKTGGGFVEPGMGCCGGV